MHHRWLLAFVGSLPAALVAQVATGDIAVTGFSANAFGVIDASLAVTGYATPGFQGTGTATSQAVLWDPQHPNDFVIGGFGFVGRATIVGPGAVSYALITNGVGIVAQMSWTDAGLIAFVDSGTDQVRLLDPASGTVVDLSAGAQPWGADANAGALDPRTGDVVVGGNGALYRLANGSAVATPIASGLGGYVSAVAFDPATGEVVATVLTANRVIRVAADGTVTDIAPPFSVPGPNALAVDPNGDFVTGGGTGQVYRVPRAGGSPVFLANNTSPANAVNGLAVAGGGGFAIPFGTACAGAFGPALLAVTGPYVVGASLLLRSSNHAPNSPGVLVLGLSDATWLGLPLPLSLDGLLGTSGCWLHVSGDATLAGLSTASAPSTLDFTLVLPAAFAGIRFYAQHVGLEAVPGGLSWSNGVAIRVP